jgi:hypothetical protein
VTPTILPAPRLPLPWYRHAWVWLLIAIPASSVLVGITMVILAVNGPTDLVRDDYYKAGLAINQDLSGVRRARALGVVATLSRRTADSWLLVVETGPEAAAPERFDALEIQLQHPTLAARDLSAEAESVARGRWAVTLPAFSGTRVLTARPRDGSWVFRQELRLDGLDSDTTVLRLTSDAPDDP